MGRVLLFLLFGAVAWLLVKKLKQISAAQDEQAPAAKPAEAMKRCSQCGVYVAESEALQKDERYFCCADHRDKFKG